MKQLDLDPRSSAVDALHYATAFYTAAPVVNDLLKRINWPSRPGRLLDPSSGDGSFLICALTTLEFAVDDVDAVQRVRGYEIHPEAVRESRERIVQHLVSRGWTHSIAEVAALKMVRERDFLIIEPDEIGFSIIVGNPPFLRFGRMPDYFRDLYRKIVPSYARADILYSFLDRCCEMLPPDGVIALVTSDRWTMNLCTAELRAKMGRRLGISHLARLDETTCFYQAKCRRKNTPPRVHPIAVILESAGENAVPITDESLILNDKGLDRDQSKALLTLRDIATVRLGPYMGSPGTFVVDKDVADKLTGARLVPVVGPNEIPPDRDILLPTRRFAIITGAEEPTGPVADHLRRVFPLMPGRCRARGIYWRPYEPMNLALTGPRLLVPRIAKRIRVIDIPDGIAPIDHNISVVALNGADIETIRSVLLSQEANEWIRNNARRIENGYLDISCTLLRRLPVPTRFVEPLPRTGTML